MPASSERYRPHQNALILATVRMLIASYFLASAGLIKNADGATFLSSVLPETTAEALAATIFYGTGFALMIGRFMREAALVLAIFVFWASFSAKLDSAPSIAVLMHFWQDMALVGAVLLIGLTRPGGERPMRLGLGRARLPRRIRPGMSVSRRRDRPALASTDAAAHRAAKLSALDDEPEVENIFADPSPA